MQTHLTEIKHVIELGYAAVINDKVEDIKFIRFYVSHSTYSLPKATDDRRGIYPDVVPGRTGLPIQTNERLILGFLVQSCIDFHSMDRLAFDYLPYLDILSINDGTDGDWRNDNRADRSSDIPWAERKGIHVIYEKMDKNSTDC